MADLGKEEYLKQNELQREQHVYDQMMANKERFTAAEIADAKRYMNDERSLFGLDPMELDAIEEGAPAGNAMADGAKAKAGGDGDLYEDPTKIDNSKNSNGRLMKKSQ